MRRLGLVKVLMRPRPRQQPQPRRSWFFRSVIRHGQRWLVGSVLAVAALLALALWTMPDPRISVVLNASAELLTFRVINPELAAFRVAGMRAIREDDDTGDCLSGIVSPVLGTTVTYLVAREDRMAIGLAPSSQTPDGRVANVSRAGVETPLDGFWRLRSDPLCEGDKPGRLPIHGVAEFGREYSAPTEARDALSGLLVSGKLTIYGHAIGSLLGLKLPRSLYEWKKIDVPGGSRIAAWAEQSDTTDAVWWGVARVEADKDKGTSILQIDASTNARGMRLAIPGVPDQDGRLSFDKFSQITSDPTIVAIQIYIGFAFLLIQTLFSAWKKLGELGRPRE